MTKRILHTSLLMLILCCNLSFASEPQIVTYGQDGNRLPYEVELLQHALDLTQDEYGEAKTQQYDLKGIRFEIALAKREFDVAFLPSSAQREKRLQVVKIPLTQGLLSYRLIVTRKDKTTQFEKITTIDEFKTRLIGGVGVHWQTLQMFSRNNMLIRTAYEKSELYGMLVAGEIDYFPRGLDELSWEAGNYKEAFKQLTVSPDVALFYILPRYYFVRHGAPELAERIEKGLLKALTDGSFRSIFLKHYQDEIDMLKKLKVKKIIYLDNPDLTLTYPMKWHWWLDKAPAASPKQGSSDIKTNKKALKE